MKGWILMITDFQQLMILQDLFLILKQYNKVIISIQFQPLIRIINCGCGGDATHRVCTVHCAIHLCHTLCMASVDI